MSLFSFFRRSAPIRSAAELADFIDQHAAFVVQKGIYEYSRARAGHYAKVLFKEPGFLEAVEVARWRAYPLGLAMVGELVNGVLHPFVGAERQAALEALSAIVLDVFDRYSVPAALGAWEWRELRQKLVRQLGLMGMHSPKLVKDIPERVAKEYFALMPIHEKLRGSDYPTIRNYLRVTMCNIHDVLTKRMDPRAMAATLCGCADAAPDGVV
ncbi:MAG: hypothetical protein WBX07_18305 [Rhodoplanes sp.]